MSVPLCRCPTFTIGRTISTMCHTKHCIFTWPTSVSYGPKVLNAPPVSRIVCAPRNFMPRFCELKGQLYSLKWLIGIRRHLIVLPIFRNVVATPTNCTHAKTIYVRLYDKNMCINTVLCGSKMAVSSIWSDWSTNNEFLTLEMILSYLRNHRCHNQY